MSWLLILGLLVVWVLLNMKSSRPDGKLIKVHPFRRMFPFIMPTRNESVVYFDSYVDAEQLLEYLGSAKKEFECDVTHAVVKACGIGLAEVPKMNRFVSGKRLYQRNGNFLTFSMTRKKLDREAKLAAVKMEIPEDESFKDFCARVQAKVNVERSDKKTYTDKELSLFLLFPRPVLAAAVSLFKKLDYYGLLPASFIKGDGMFTSVFVANLGSLKMGAGYHHLFEWGNCPLFAMVGQIEDKVVARDGEVCVRKTLHIRYTYEERIDDGLNARFGIDAVKTVLENPFERLGCLSTGNEGGQLRAS